MVHSIQSFPLQKRAISSTSMRNKRPLSTAFAGSVSKRARIEIPKDSAVSGPPMDVREIINQPLSRFKRVAEVSSMLLHMLLESAHILCASSAFC